MIEFLPNILQLYPEENFSVKLKHSLARRRLRRKQEAQDNEAYIKLAGFGSSFSFRQTLAFCMALFSTSPFSSVYNGQITCTSIKTMETIKKKKHSDEKCSFFLFYICEMLRSLWTATDSGAFMFKHVCWFHYFIASSSLTSITGSWISLFLKNYSTARQKQLILN